MAAAAACGSGSGGGQRRCRSLRSQNCWQLRCTHEVLSLCSCCAVCNLCKCGWQHCAAPGAGQPAVGTAGCAAAVTAGSTLHHSAPVLCSISYLSPFQSVHSQGRAGSGARGSGRVNTFPGPLAGLPPRRARSGLPSMDDINSVSRDPKDGAAPRPSWCASWGSRPQVHGFIPLRAFSALCILELAPLQR